MRLFIPRVATMVTTRSRVAGEGRAAAEATSYSPTAPVIALFIALLIAIFSFFHRSWPSMGFANMSVRLVIASSQPEIVSDGALAIVRTVCWATIAVSLYLRFRNQHPEVIEPHYFPMSRLPAGASIRLSGFKIFSTFTVQAWTLQGFYFAGTAALALHHRVRGGAGNEEGAVLHAVACTLWAVYQVSFGCAALVSAVVTFVLIPGLLRRGETPIIFFQPTVQLMHNANILFMATELLFNSLPILSRHLAFTVLFGLCYVPFSWVWVRRTGIVYYAFLDPTLPPRLSVPIHVGLVLALALFTSLGVLMQSLTSGFSFPLRALLVYSASCCLCWTSLFRGTPRPSRMATRGRVDK